MFKTNFSGRNKIWGDTKEIWGALPPNALRVYGPECRGCKRTPKSFDVVKIWAKFLKICENLFQISENLGKNGAQRGLI